MRGDLSGAHWIQMCVKEAETKAVGPVVDAEPGFVVRLVESCLVQVQEEHCQRLVVAVRAAAVVQVPHTSDEIASHGDVLRCFEPHLQIRVQRTDVISKSRSYRDITGSNLNMASPLPAG